MLFSELRGILGGFNKFMVPASNSEDFKTLFEKRYKDLSVKEGEVLEGTVVEVRRDTVMVNVGFKSEGAVRLEEFRDFDGEVKVQQGDSVRVMVEQIEDQKGVIVLSKERADALESWDRVAAVHDSNESIEGMIFNKIKGGMSVNLGGIKAFLPASQIDLKPVKSLDKLIGTKAQFKILKLNKAKGNIVLSRRAVLEEERASQREDLLKNLKEGQVVKGFVKNITDYGAFVDLGGIDGLLHITDLSWGRVSHPSEVIKMGDEIEVVVLKYDKEQGKVSLGYKQLQSDPWEDVEQKFTVGQNVSGKVVNIADYGVFIELTDGIEGLVHISELTWNKKIKHPSKIVKEGDEVEAVILDLDPKNRRISLGVKQLEPNPWNGLIERFPIDTRVKGVVRNITDFGVFVGIEGEEIDGLVHISDLTWDKNVKHPSDLYKKGDEIEAIVLSVDKNNERFSLGVKQLSDDPLDVLRNKYQVGSIVKGKVSEFQARGVLLILDEDVVGYISNIDLSAHEKVVAKEHFKEGDEIEGMVKKFDEREKRVVLSVKAMEKAEEKKSLKEFKSKQGDVAVTLKDALKE